MPKMFCSNDGLPGSFTKALSYDEQIQYLIDRYNKMADVLNNLEFETKLDYVAYEPQSRNELQKEQARNNIGAGTSKVTTDDIYTQIDKSAVKFNEDQNLTTDQETQARVNIGAGTSNLTSNDISTQINNNCVKFTPQTLTEEQKTQARNNIGAGTGSGGGSTENAVLYTEQELTESEKTQARNNIGAGASNVTPDDINTQIDNSSVKYNSEQSLTGEQKLQARNNIGAGTSNITTNNITAIIEGSAVKYTTVQELTSAEKSTARTNIGAGTSNVVTYTRSVVCTAANWTGTGPYTQELTVQGIVADSRPIIDYDFSSATTTNIDDLLTEFNKVNRFVAGTNKITAYCYGEKPTIAVPINILVVI